MNIVSVGSHAIEFLEMELVCLLRFSKLNANQCREKAVDPLIKTVNVYNEPQDIHSELTEWNKCVVQALIILEFPFPG